jgi:hypothetical protein
MKVTPKQADGERLVEAMVELVQHTYPETLAPKDERGLARLEEAWHRSRQAFSSSLTGATSLPRITTPARRRVRVLVAAFATLALVIGGTAVYRRVDKLTYEVMNGTIGPGGFVNPTAAGTAILFSEGSEITLGESSRTRVDNLTADGGRVVVESGTVHARIVPRKHAHWIVEAGPYTIRVTGTAFKVHWSWSDEMLDVQMQRGSVIVTGPLAPSGVTLTAGMRLTANPGSGLAIGDGVATTALDSHRSAPGSASAGSANVPTGQVEDIREDTPGEDATTPPAVDAPAVATPLVGHAKAGVAHRGPDRRVALLAPDGTARSSESHSSESWDKQLARGDVEGILADADARGVDRLLGRASEQDLSALADAARYGHRPTLARRALLTIRDRFSRSAEARDAAFFLGGLAEDATGSDSQMSALEWYRRYLGESPGGRYVAQAIGRKMIMTARLNGTDAAHPIADEYLARFPDGPYAAAARKLTQTR